ncbi:MAG: LysR family transcriptional regulator [Betaproteobacteria bacterium]|nr:LysR family transcriptional regulator [Betaproteobacteria bacterium]
MLRRKSLLPATIASTFVLTLSLGMSSANVWAEDENAAAQDSPFKVGGYVRGWLSMNLQDQPEVADAKDKLSMVRASALLDADWKPATTVRFKAIGRVDREYKTDYLKSLEVPPNTFPGNGSIKDVFTTNAGGGIGGVMNNYNQGEVRELWGEVDLTDRIKLKVGKQQVVWGETDFFRAMDLVHGFDYRWRSFLEAENEELRKPLILARMMLQVPEVKGSLDMFVRPGIDAYRAIGNTYDIAGGRWGSQPAKGGSFFYATGYNYRSEGADVRDTTGGIRWQAQAAGINYSIAALKTFNNDPVFNPCPANLQFLYQGAGSSGAFTPFKQTPLHCAIAYNPYQPGGVQPQFGDWVFPNTNILGVTASAYSDLADAVFSTEIVFQKDRSFNYGLQNGRFGYNIIPGSFGIIQKNTLTTMFRMDKTVDLSKLIGTSRPSFGSIQFFNTHIQGFNKADEIVELAFWSRPKPKDSALLTAILGMNYSNDRINPTIAAGWDVTDGGGFIIPSVEWVLGDNWRIKGELDLFFYNGDQKTRYLNPTTFAWEEKGRGAGLFGYFAHNNQAVIRVTRQF